MALANGNSASGKLVSEEWTSVETKLSEMDIEHFLDDKGEYTGFILYFDFSPVVRGFHGFLGFSVFASLGSGMPRRA